MRVSVIRKDVKFIPDSSRVVARYFKNSDQRTQIMVSRVMALDEKQVALTLEHTLREFANRHRNISRVFYNHCATIQWRRSDAESGAVHGSYSLYRSSGLAPL